MPQINLHNVNCMEFMKNCPDKAYGLAIVDPPFFKGVANGKFYGTGLSGTGRKRGVYKKIDNWDNNIPGNDYYSELVRVSKHQIIWGINYFTDFKNVPVGRIVWDKKNDHSTFSNCEIASCSQIEAVKIFRYQWNGFFQEPGFQKEQRFHPTQKPVELYKYILENYAQAGDKILDTHGGSMSIAIACYDLSFDLDLCELDKDYFQSGQKRLDEHIAKYEPASKVPATKKGELKLF